MLTVRLPQQQHKHALASSTKLVATGNVCQVINACSHHVLRMYGMNRPTSFQLDKFVIGMQLFKLLSAERQRQSVEQGQLGIGQHGKVPDTGQAGAAKAHCNIHKVEVNGLAVVAVAPAHGASDCAAQISACT